MSVALGGCIGPYEVLRRIGAGGMGEVYRATDTKLNRDVALKVLPPRSRTTPSGWPGRPNNVPSRLSLLSS